MTISQASRSTPTCSQVTHFICLHLLSESIIGYEPLAPVLTGSNPVFSPADSDGRGQSDPHPCALTLPVFPDRSYRLGFGIALSRSPPGKARPSTIPRAVLLLPIPESRRPTTGIV